MKAFLSLFVTFSAAWFHTNAVEALNEFSSHYSRELQKVDVTFIEEGGLLIMEAESAVIEAPWVFGALQDASFKKFTGNGYYNAVNRTAKPGVHQGLLKYKFRIDNPGKYRLFLRSNKIDENPNIGNDCYTRIIGVTERTRTYQVDASRKWTYNTFHSTTNGDLIPFYTFEAPGVYTFEISSLSNGFYIDRIVLFDTEKISTGQAKTEEIPESQRITKTSKPSTAPVSVPPTKSPTRAPTKTPTKAPTKIPTKVPTKQPTQAPITSSPTKKPTSAPTTSPTNVPLGAPAAPVIAAPVIAGPTAPSVSSAPVISGPTAPSVIAAPVISGPTAPSVIAAPVISGPTAPVVKAPTRRPRVKPTIAPVALPTTKAPINPTPAPVPAPVRLQTLAPVRPPTTAPIRAPTTAPIRAPTKAPFQPLTDSPSDFPVVPDKRCRCPRWRLVCRLFTRCLFNYN